MFCNHACKNILHVFLTVKKFKVARNYTLLCYKCNIVNKIHTLFQNLKFNYCCCWSQYNDLATREVQLIYTEPEGTWILKKSNIKWFIIYIVYFLIDWHIKLSVIKQRKPHDLRWTYNKATIYNTRYMKFLGNAVIKMLSERRGL